MMQEQIDRIEGKVNQISDSMLGTEYTGNKGMIDAIHQNTKFRRRAGWFSGVVFGLGMVLSWVKDKLFLMFS